MGQKVHPIGFRLGIHEEHKSRWYEKLSNYSTQLKIDNELRTLWIAFLNDINKKQAYETTDRYNLLIFHPPARNQVHLIIRTTSPIRLIKSLKKISYFPNFSKNLSDYLSHKKLLVIINRLKHPFLEPTLLAQSLAKNLEKRMPFRRAIRKTIIDFKKAAKRAKRSARRRGIKIQISGRLNGAEIARVEWVRKGKVPLHTIKAKVNYASERAQTIYGIIGIKIWLYKG